MGEETTGASGSVWSVFEERRYAAWHSVVAHGWKVMPRPGFKGHGSKPRSHERLIPGNIHGFHSLDAGRKSRMCETALEPARAPGAWGAGLHFLATMVERQESDSAWTVA